MLARNKLPISGDKLLDDMFKVLVEVLRKEIRAIYLKKDLRYPDKHRQALDGLLIEDDAAIYLNKPKHLSERPMILSALIHELLHRALGRSSEWRIKSLEKSLFDRRTGFTYEQKRYFAKYIPKHAVKHGPSLEIRKNK
ncbi:MAG: hypothetical protein Q8P07_00665 [bacterium]|nr:hypothetical protein [bacterium]